jgi:hypothetical protein
MYLCFGLSCASNTIFDFFDSTFVHIILILQQASAGSVVCVFVKFLDVRHITNSLSFFSFLFRTRDKPVVLFYFCEVFLSFFIPLALCCSSLSVCCVVAFVYIIRPWRVTRICTTRSTTQQNLCLFAAI